MPVPLIEPYVQISSIRLSLNPRYKAVIKRSSALVFFSQEFEAIPLESRIEGFPLPEWFTYPLAPCSEKMLGAYLDVVISISKYLSGVSEVKIILPSTEGFVQFLDHIRQCCIAVFVHLLFDLLSDGLLGLIRWEDIEIFMRLPLEIPVLPESTSEEV